MAVAGFPTAQAAAVTAALQAAMERVSQGMMPPMPGPGPVGRLFGSLGETLTWIIALDEMLEDADVQYKARRNADPDGRVLRGLRFARNHAVHGAVVAALFHGGAGLGLMQLGNAGLGQGPSYRWRPSAELPPLAQPQPLLKEVYDLHIGGRALITILNPAVAYLRLEAGT